MIQKIKGTQDFLDLTLYNFLISKTRTQLHNYAFNEISTPILEPLALFQRSLGLHTDVITKEMYMVSSGKEAKTTPKEPTQICLRPEATAPTMRAFFNNSIEKRPWKVFSQGPIFRHERPQKGRFRQFHQVTIENIGAESIAYDAELIAMLDHFFTDHLKIESYALLINFLGSPQDRENYKQVLKDFLDKQANLPEKIVELKDKNILRIFDLKAPECKQALENAPLITDHLSPESQKEWELLQSLLNQLSISYSCDPRLVRGLDYYNKTVFEFVSEHLGAQSAFCGGGRYDYLSQALGEKEAVPALGAAFGIERVIMLLEHHKDKLNIPQKPALQVVVPFAVEHQALALLVTDELCASNICCETLLDITSVKSMMRKANKLGAQHVLLIGDDEMANNYITIKNMTTGNEEKIKQSDLVVYFKGKTHA